MEAYDSYLSEQAVPLARIKPEDDGKTVTVGGVVSNIRQITTKNGQPMAFVKIEDNAGDEIELVVFPSVFKDTTESWNREKVLLVSGRVSGMDRSNQLMPEAKVLVESVKIITPDEAKAYQPKGTKATLPKTIANKAPLNNKRLYLRMQDTSDEVTLQKLKSILDEHSGSYEAVLVLGDKNKQVIKLPQQINADDQLVGSLAELLGRKNVKFQ